MKTIEVTPYEQSILMNCVGYWLNASDDEDRKAGFPGHDQKKVYESLESLWRKIS